MNVTGILTDCKDVKNGEGLRFLVAGREITAWYGKYDPCETPRDDILSLQNRQVSCDFTENPKGDKVWLNAVRVEAHAGPTSVPAASTGETMSKADWELKDRRITRTAIAKSLLALGTFDGLLAERAFCWVWEAGYEIAPESQEIQGGFDIESAKKALDAYWKKQPNERQDGKGWNRTEVTRWIKCTMEAFDPPEKGSLLTGLDAYQIDKLNKAMIQDEIESV